MNEQNQQTEPKNAAPPKHVATAGEKKFDWRTYWGVGYVVNALLSVVAVLWVERTHSGQSFMKNLMGGFEKNLSWTKLKPESLKTIAKSTFYLTGGFAVMAPMKWLEDKKVPLVKKWNREIYGAQADTDPVIQQSERELEAAPKQSWSSILSARAIALVPFYAVVSLILSRKSPLAKLTNQTVYLDRPISIVSRCLGKGAAFVMGDTKAAKQIDAVWKQFPGIIKEGEVGSTLRDPIHSALPSYGISEAVLSAIVAWSIYVLTRITGPFFGKSKNTTSQKVAAAEPAASIVRAIYPQKELANEEKAERPGTRVHKDSIENHTQHNEMALAR